MQHDLHVTSLPVAALVPYAENARTHSDTQVAQIAASIAEFGFVNPVLVDAAGVLVAGHGRVLGAKRLGMTAVPAIRLQHLSEAQARALRLADNQIALNSGWDEDLLATEIARIGERGQQRDFGRTSPVRSRKPPTRGSATLGSPSIGGEQVAAGKPRT